MINYNDDIQIDIDNLDQEWLRQATIYMKYVDLLAEANLQRDLAKEKIDIMRARLSLEVRNDPQQYGLEKITENAVSSIVLTHPKYEKVITEHLELKKDSEILSGIVRALDHKKKALEKLVELEISGYFSQPREPKGVPEDKKPSNKNLDEKIKGQNEDLNKKHNKYKRTK